MTSNEVSQLFDALGRHAREKGVMYVVLEADTRHPEFTDWDLIAKSATEKLNAAFEDSPLRFSCTVEGDND